MLISRAIKMEVLGTQQKLIKALSSLLEEKHEPKTPRKSVARRWGSRKGRRESRGGRQGGGR